MKAKVCFSYIQLNLIEKKYNMQITKVNKPVNKWKIKYEKKVDVV